MPAKNGTLDSGLLRLAKLVAEDLRQGTVSPGLRNVGATLSQSPETGGMLLGLLRAEMSRKRPKTGLIDALLLLIGEALTSARLASEADAHGPGAEFVAAFRGSLVAAVEAGDVPLDLLMAVAQQFASAKLDPGDALRALMVALTEQEFSGEAVGPDDLASHFDAMADALNHDPFEIHETLAAQLVLFPEAQKSVMVESLAFSDVPAMREAALGWLLDPNPTVSRLLALNLAEAAMQGLVSDASAGRLVLMRPWIPEAVHAGVDTAIRSCRQRNTRPVAPIITQVGTVLASACDGAGAQTFLIPIKRGRKLALASLLLKHDVGVRDAWLSEGLSKRDLDELLAEIGLELDAFEASPEIVRTAIAHGLAVGSSRNEPPPFKLVRCLEAIGLTQIHPDRLSVEALVAQLLAAIPAERQTPKAVAASLTASKDWPKHYAFPHSWFEQDQAAQTITRSRSGKSQREAKILADVLPARRTRWAELLAWTAQAAQDQVEDDAWIDFALVARELLGERPLTEIPIAVWIAKNTLAAATTR